LIACTPPAAPVAGAPEIVLHDIHPKSFALSKDAIVWSSLDGHTSKIYSTPRHGGDSKVMLEGVPSIRAIVVHGDSVYYAAEDVIGRVPFKGVLEALVESPGVELAVTDDALVWTAPDLGLASTGIHGGEPRTLIASHILRGMLVTGDHAYVGGNPQILRVPLGFGEAKPIGDVEVCSNAMLEHEGALYVGGCHGVLERIPLDGSEAKVLAPDIGFVTSIAESGDRLVLAFGPEHALGVIPFAGGELRKIQIPTGAERIAIDPREPNIVYVLDEGTSTETPTGHITRITI
jgi:hypothetical protein